MIQVLIPSQLTANTGGASRVEAAFGSEKFARLQQIKTEWDPDNVFRNNQNIPPAPAVPPQR